jgi:hypothetical protein
MLAAENMYIWIRNEWIAIRVDEGEKELVHNSK